MVDTVIKLERLKKILDNGEEHGILVIDEAIDLIDTMNHKIWSLNHELTMAKLYNELEKEYGNA